MVLAWVTHPDNKFPMDPELNKSIEEKQKLFAAIDKGGDVECCHICGSTENLSLEHTPPKSAFNKKSFLSLSVLHPLTQFLQRTAIRIQGGSRSKALCKTCNNHTGSWYNPEYIKLARYCSSFAKPENANKIIPIKARLYPARIIKQALTNICSVSQPGLCKEYLYLKDFLMDRSKIVELKPLKLGLFMGAASMGRSSGVTIFVDTKRNIARLMAEFSFWPLGWVLTLDDLPCKGTLDITSWSTYGVDEKIDLSLDVPCQWAVSPYPGDFRLPDEVFKK